METLVTRLCRLKVLAVPTLLGALIEWKRDKRNQRHPFRGFLLC